MYYTAILLLSVLVHEGKIVFLMNYKLHISNLTGHRVHGVHNKTIYILSIIIIILKYFYKEFICPLSIISRSSSQ